MERVFIAWTGKYGQDIAKKVSLEIERYDFDATIGGQGVNNESIVGQQVIDEMRKSTCAIIILCPRTDDEESTNLFYEWGYLTKQFPNDKLFPFIIDYNQDNLPSDIKGSWVNPINSSAQDIDISNKSEREKLGCHIAQMFLNKYREEISRYYNSAQNIQIFTSYNKYKSDLNGYSNTPKYPNAKVSNIVLVSLFSAYYNDDISNLKTILLDISKSTQIKSFRKIIGFAVCSIELFEKTEMLSKRLSADDYAETREELKSLLEYIEKADERKNIIGRNSFLYRLWKIIVLDRLALCYSLCYRATRTTEMENLKKAIDGYIIEIEEINKLSAETKNDWFLHFLESLVHRSLAVCYKKIGDTDKYIECLEKTIEIRKDVNREFNITYGAQKTNADIKEKLKQELYLVQLELYPFVDELESREGSLSIESYIEKYREYLNGKNTLFNVLQRAKEENICTNIGQINYNMLVSDLDDTLIRDDFTISQKTVDAIFSMQNKGYHFIISSGRTISSIMPYYNLLQLSDYIITNHGALVVNPSTGVTIIEDKIPYEIAAKILMDLEKKDIWLNVYTENEIIVSHFSDLNKSYSLRCDTNANFYETNCKLSDFVIKKKISPLKIEIETIPPLVQGVKENVLKNFSKHINAFSSKNWTIEIISNNVNKGNAVKRIAEEYSVPYNQIICVGNAESDIQLFDYCERRIVVSNATDAIKKISDETVASNNEDGVLELITHYFQ